MFICVEVCVYAHTHIYMYSNGVYLSHQYPHQTSA